MQVQSAASRCGPTNSSAADVVLLGGQAVAIALCVHLRLRPGSYPGRLTYLVNYRLQSQSVTTSSLTSTTRPPRPTFLLLLTTQQLHAAVPLSRCTTPHHPLLLHYSLHEPSAPRRRLQLLRHKPRRTTRGRLSDCAREAGLFFVHRLLS